MGWARFYIENLQKGITVQFKPHGNSMRPLVCDGDQVTVSPDLKDLQVGDVVLCKVRGREYLHLLKAMDGERYQIANNRGHVNGWIGRTHIYGRVTAIDRKG